MTNYLNKQKLRNFSCKFSNDIAKLSNQNRFKLENHVSISNGHIESNAEFAIGAYTYIRSKSEFIGKCNIGRFCSLSQNVILGLERNAHPTNWLSTSLYRADLLKAYKLTHKADITIIGNDCWIGRNVTILSGVSIGDGVIVGAGSIVTNDLAPYGIYAGVPAKLIKYRFDENLISTLTSVKWWDFDSSYLLKLPFNDLCTSINLIQSEIGQIKLAKYDQIEITSGRVRVSQ